MEASPDKLNATLHNVTQQIDNHFIRKGTPYHRTGGVYKWDLRFLALAAHISEWSKDPSTKCGAVITLGKRVISLGFNGFPAGVSDHLSDLNDRSLKYEKVLHAEENAIIFSRQDLTGCTIYTHPLPPCARCAGKIIQTGIVRVVAPIPSVEIWERWGNDMLIASAMYQEVGVELVEVILC